MPKTLEEYSTISKLLKLDILKIKLENQEMVKKLGESNKEENTVALQLNQSILNNKESIAVSYVNFHRLGNALKKIGLTPESLFRMCDQKKTKKITTQSLIKVINKLRLGLQRAVIDSVVVKLDYQRTNSVEYQHFMGFVNAFQINTQNYPFKSSKTYQQLTLLRLAQICKDENIDLKQLDTERDLFYGEFKRIFQKSLAKHNLSEHQMITLFLKQDSTHSFKICPKPLYEQLKTEVKNIKARKKQKDQTSNKQNIFDINKDNISSKIESVDPFSILPSKSVIKKGVDLSVLIDVLLKRNLSSTFDSVKALPLNKAFSINQVKQIVAELSGEAISKEQFIAFYQSLDVSKKGTITLFDLATYFVSNKDPSQSYSPMITLLANFIALKKYIPESYLATYGVDIGKNISYETFLKLWTQFNLEEKVLKQIYLETKAGEKQLEADLFIRILKNHFDFKDPAPSVVLHPIPTQIMLNELKEYEEIIKKFAKPLKDDYFQKVNTENTEERWQTIFTKESTALLTCYNSMKIVMAQRKNDKNNKIKWRDPQFGSVPGDIHGWKSINNSNQSLSFLPPEQDIVWVDYDEFLQKLGSKTQKNYKSYFINENIKSNDIIQSEGLGNCWFIAALSLLTNHKQLLLGVNHNERQINKLVLGVYPSLFHVFSKYGIYLFRFYKNRKPIFVMVDNTVPMNKNTNQVLFCRSSNPKAMWAILIEKAYAKLHHTYQNIEIGEIIEGISDLTGYFTVKDQIQPSLYENNDRKDQLWNRLLRWKKDDLMGCSINQASRNQADIKKNGLYINHAYAIIHLIEINSPESANYHKSHRLVCLRNPQGSNEWNGSWSEIQAKQLQDESKLRKNKDAIKQYFETKNKELKRMREDNVQAYTLNEGDGMFLMCFKDWRSYFDNCYRGVKLKSSYKRYAINSMWTSEFTSGFPKSVDDKTNFFKLNYQYKMQVKAKCEIYVMLSQKDGRLYQNLKYPYSEICVPLCIVVIKSDEDKLTSYDSSKVIKITKVERKRNVAVQLELQKGLYFIVPCTQSCKQNKLYPSFTLEVITETDLRLDPKFKQQPEDQQPKNDAILELLHRKLWQNNSEFKIEGQ